MPKKISEDTHKILAKVAELLNTDEMSVLRMIEHGMFPRPEDRLINIRQISAWIGVSEKTIYNWIKNNQFPEPMVLGKTDHHLATKRWYFTEIKAWLHGQPRGTSDHHPKKKRKGNSDE
jgi:predicted DNA-binding transcriptional regulator AlpA